MAGGQGFADKLPDACIPELRQARWPLVRVSINRARGAEETGINSASHDRFKNFHPSVRQLLSPGTRRVFAEGSPDLVEEIGPLLVKLCFDFGGQRFQTLQLCLEL